MRRSNVIRCLALVAAVGAGCSGGSDDAVGPTSVPETVVTTVPEAAAGLEWTPALTELGLSDPTNGSWRTVYATGFEDDADLADFYVTPQSPMTRHEVEAGGVRHAGERAHHGWLTGVVGTEPVDGPNHRGYPTIQLARRPPGPCPSPCLVDLWMRLDDSPIAAGEWISFATFTTDASDRWSRVVTVNVGSEGWLHLFHVPTHGSGERVFQGTDAFPRDQWVRVTTLLDLSAEGGAGAVWQDGVLMSAARIEGGDGDLDQMHFGLYAPPSVLQGSVWNDDITVLAPS